MSEQSNITNLEEVKKQQKTEKELYAERKKQQKIDQQRKQMERYLATPITRGEVDGILNTIVKSINTLEDERRKINYTLSVFSKYLEKRDDKYKENIEEVTKELNDEIETAQAALEQKRKELLEKQNKKEPEAVAVTDINIKTDEIETK